VTAMRRILLPLDGSRLAEAALPVGRALAAAAGATLVLLHVLERNATPQVHGERHLTETGEAERYLAHVADDLAAAGLAVERHAHADPVGDVAASIAIHADAHAIDLIVLCTHGAGGIRGALWGSIAQQVVQRSACPVLLVRAGAPGGDAPFRPSTIMVSLDGTVAAEAAVAPAAALARDLGAQLRLVVVVPTIPRVPRATFSAAAARMLADVQERQASAYLERVAATVGVPARTEVRRGNAVAELATDTGEHADGLIVIATHGRAGLQAVWSPAVAARLLRRTRAPILLVPIAE
jgi:nucleotide-binding universal stress UspA family protein